MCPSQVESVDDLFVFCELAYTIWYKVFKWMCDPLHVLESTLEVF